LLPQAGDPKKPPEGADAFEPNNSPDKATPLAWDKEIQATIFPRGDVDVYRLGLDTDARVTVKIGGASPAVSLTARLLDGLKRGLIEKNAGPGRDLLLVVDLRAGTYFLELRDGPTDEFETPHWYDAGESRVPYRLVALAEKVPDPFEPNDDPKKPAAIALGKTHKLWIFPAGDRDYLSVKVPEPGIGELRITADNMPENIALEATLYRPEGGSDSAKARPGRPFFWSVPVGKPGDYRILLEAGSYPRLKTWKSNGTDSSLQPLDFRVEFLEIGDPFEPNNNFAQAASLPLGKPVTGALYPRGDIDYFKLSLPAGKRGFLRVEANGFADSIHPYLSLYTKDRGHIRTLARENGLPLVFHQPLGGADYFLLLGDNKSGSSRTRYALQADFVFEETDEQEPNDRFEDVCE